MGYSASLSRNILIHTGCVQHWTKFCSRQIRQDAETGSLASCLVSADHSW